MLNKKTWTNQQTKNHKENHNLDWSDHTYDREIQNTCISILNTTNTIYAENCESSRVQ